MKTGFPQVRKLSKTALNILEKRYYNKNLNEKSWEDIVDRVIREVSNEPDGNKEVLRDIITNTYFIPNSPCLVNAGKRNGGLMACFVVAFPDTIEGIFETKLDFALIARKGGGCGTDLSEIRPEGDPVDGSAHGYAGGPLKFANTISHDAEALTQAGFRSMAIMFSMSVYHPDIIRFITAKHSEGVIENANISVFVDNAFMEKVKNDELYWTEFNGKKYHQYKARDIFDLIVEGAWKNGEPGLLFRDRIDDSPYAETGRRIYGTNPCSEQPLPANGSCNLGSIDLSKFVLRNGEMDWEKLETVVRYGVRFLDDVISKTSFPTEKIKASAIELRQLGLGIMGYADYLLIKKIAYGSKEALYELETILSFIRDKALDESITLGEERGLPLWCRNLQQPRRNITLLTVAPTGTISLLAGCSSGIEPIFSEITVRNDKTGTYTFENNLAEKDYFRCAVSSNGAKEVTWEEHIDTLSSAQKFVDSGVSKTVNCPTHTRKETVGKMMFTAWEKQCKGVAIYRNGSRKTEVLSPKNLKKDRCPICGGDIIELNGKKKCPTCPGDAKIPEATTFYD